MTTSNVLNISNNILWIVQVLFFSTSGNAILCYCTNHYCKEQFCESSWCLIGHKENEGVVKACGTETASAFQNCRQSIGLWSEICSCNEHNYCNSFRTFRGGGGPPMTAYLRAKYAQQRRTNLSSNQFNSGRTNVKIEILTQTDNGIVTIVDGNKRTGSGTGSGFGQLLLESVPPKTDVVVLVVVVPLCLGAASVVIVVFNYYCKMC